MATLDLKYYMLDWDDNILFMPTLIHLQRDGKPVDVTTKKFAEIRSDKSYEPLDGSWDKAFKGFRDGTGDFVGDLRKAIESEDYAPSYRAFKTALREARLFCIVTARDHSAATIRKGVEEFINLALSDEDRADMVQNIQKFHALAGLRVADDKCLSSYLDHNGYVGVSSPGFLKIFENETDIGMDTGANPEGAKTFAVRKFVEETIALAKNLPAETRRIAFGFSDDDKRNIAVMREFLESELVKKYPNIDFFVYNTSGAETEVEHL
ncbi:MAG: hypothetical protein IH872_05015 [Chloroflexi bacterium]|nr:hypothetical protein [Chloroflexota bacterium]